MCFFLRSACSSNRRVGNVERRNTAAVGFYSPGIWQATEKVVHDSKTQAKTPALQRRNKHLRDM